MHNDPPALATKNSIIITYIRINDKPETAQPD
jgi:hypothetical protein